MSIMSYSRLSLCLNTYLRFRCARYPQLPAIIRLLHDDKDGVNEKLKKQELKKRVSNPKDSLVEKCAKLSNVVEKLKDNKQEASATIINESKLKKPEFLKALLKEDQPKEKVSQPNCQSIIPVESDLSSKKLNNNDPKSETKSVQSQVSEIKCNITTQSSNADNSAPKIHTETNNAARGIVQPSGTSQDRSDCTKNDVKITTPSQAENPLSLKAKVEQSSTEKEKSSNLKVPIKLSANASNTHVEKFKEPLDYKDTIKLVKQTIPLDVKPDLVDVFKTEKAKILDSTATNNLVSDNFQNKVEVTMKKSDISNDSKPLPLFQNQASEIKTLYKCPDPICDKTASDDKKTSLDEKPFQIHHIQSKPISEEKSLEQHKIKKEDLSGGKTKDNLDKSETKSFTVHRAGKHNLSKEKEIPRQVQIISNEDNMPEPYISPTIADDLRSKEDDTEEYTKIFPSETKSAKISDSKTSVSDDKKPLQSDRKESAIAKKATHSVSQKQSDKSIRQDDKKEELGKLAKSKEKTVPSSVLQNQSEKSVSQDKKIESVRKSPNSKEKNKPSSVLKNQKSVSQDKKMDSVKKSTNSTEKKEPSSVSQNISKKQVIQDKIEELKNFLNAEDKRQRSSVSNTQSKKPVKSGCQDVKTEDFKNFLKSIARNPPNPPNKSFSLKNKTYGLKKPFNRDFKESETIKIKLKYDSEPIVAVKLVAERDNMAFKKISNKSYSLKKEAEGKHKNDQNIKDQSIKNKTPKKTSFKTESIRSTTKEQPSSGNVYSAQEQARTGHNQLKTRAKCLDKVKDTTTKSQASENKIFNEKYTSGIPGSSNKGIEIDSCKTSEKKTQSPRTVKSELLSESKENHLANAVSKTDEPLKGYGAQVFESTPVTYQLNNKEGDPQAEPNKISESRFNAYYGRTGSFDFEKCRAASENIKSKISKHNPVDTIFEVKTQSGKAERKSNVKYNPVDEIFQAKKPKSFEKSKELSHDSHSVGDKADENEIASTSKSEYKSFGTELERRRKKSDALLVRNKKPESTEDRKTFSVTAGEASTPEAIKKENTLVKSSMTPDELYDANSEPNMFEERKRDNIPQIQNKTQPGAETETETTNKIPEQKKADADNDKQDSQSKSKVTLSEYLYDLILGKKNNGGNNRRGFCTSSGYVWLRKRHQNKNSRHKSDEMYTDRKKKSYISPDLDKRGLGLETLRKERKIREQKRLAARRRKGDKPKNSSDGEEEQSDATENKLAAWNETKLGTSTMEESTTDIVDRLAGFDDGIRIQGGSPHEPKIKKSPELEVEPQKSGIQGGSIKHLEKLRELEGSNKSNINSNKRRFSTMSLDSW